MSETLWGVDLVQSLLPLPELTCSWLGGICVGMCIGMDASRAVGKVGHVVVGFARGLRLTACCRVCLAATGGVCYRVERYAVLSRPNYLQLCDTTSFAALAGAAQISHRGRGEYALKKR